MSDTAARRVPAGGAPGGPPEAKKFYECLIGVHVRDVQYC